jgi:hypothetical protein
VGFWYAVLVAIAGTAAALAGVGRRRRVSIVALVPMLLAHVVGTVFLLAGLVAWFSDPLAGLGEYGDEGGGEFVIVAPLLFVAAVLLSAAWVPALRRRQ